MTRTRTATVMFTDLVGSTRTLVALGQQRAGVFRREHDRLVSGCVTVNGGIVVKSTGDGLMAVFDSVQAALRAALQVQACAARMDLRWPDVDVAIRVGLSVGDAVEENGDWHGRTVNEAARLCDLADGGEVLASAVVASVAGSEGPELVDLGTRELKGIGDLGVVQVAASEIARRGAAIPSSVTRSLDQVMVGRDAEIRRVREFADAVAAGERRAVVVAGEAGIGKTRFAAEVAFDLAGSGWRVLHGRCEQEAVAPFQPFVEALTPVVLELSDDELADHLGTYGHEIERFFPRGPTRRPPSNDDPVEQQTAQLRLFGSAAALLRRSSAHRPTMVLLEDVQWATPDTLRLVAHLLDDPDPAGILYVLTCRNTDVKEGSEVDRLLNGVDRDPRGWILELRGLGPEATRSLVELVATGSRDHFSELVDTVLQNAHGNPLFVQHLAVHLSDMGATSGDWQESGYAGLAVASVPTEIRALVRSRVANLDEDAASVLATASVCGSAFSVGLLGRVHRSDRDDLLDSVDTLILSGFFREDPARPGALEFAHPVVQSVMRGQMTATRRARIHCRVAEALNATEPVEDDEVIALAWHGCRGIAGGIDPDLAVSWALAGAERALDRLAADEALALVEAVSEQAEGRSLEPRRGFELQEVALRAHDQKLDTGAIRSAFLAALDTLIAAGEPEWAGELRPIAALGRQNTDDPELYERLDRVLALIGDRPSPTRARVLAVLAWRMLIGGQAAEAREAARKASQLASSLDDPIVGSGTRLVLGLSLIAPGTMDSARRELAGAAREAALGGDSWECRHYEMSAERFLGIAALIEGDREILDSHIGTHEEKAERTGIRLAQAHTRQLRAMLALLDGDLQRAEVLAARVLEVAADEPSYQLGHASQMQVIRRDQGRSAEFLPLVEMVASTEPDSVPVLAVLSQMLVETGSADRGRELLGHATGLLELGASRHWLGSLVLSELADVAALLGDAEAAELLLPRLEPHRGHLVLSPSGVVCLGGVDRHLGQLLLTLGDPLGAVELFESSASAEERVDAPACRARTLAWMSSALSQVGSPGADPVQAECRRLVDAHGLHGIAELLERPRTASSS